ncbi:MAG TPA: 30S ribosomal protein S16 [Ignavibacteriaceae bacterium]|nr:30S ribosomal protein S16 [Ignavibacteriaceae bacterium]
MAVKLRLRRMGKKKQPIYKIVAADARSPRDGKYLESLGLYNPLTNPLTLEIKEDRALYWLGVGAQPTDTVKSLLRQKGILLKKELTKRGLSEDKVAAEMEDWSKQKEAKASTRATKKAKTEAKAEPKVEEPKAEETKSESEPETSTPEV